jgi:hypothetical protein
MLETWEEPVTQGTPVKQAVEVKRMLPLGR